MEQGKRRESSAVSRHRHLMRQRPLLAQTAFGSDRFWRGALDLGQFDLGQKKILQRFVRLGPKSTPPPPPSRFPWWANTVEPRRVGPLRVGGPTFRAFSPLPPQFFFPSLSLGVLSWNFGGV